MIHFSKVSEFVNDISKNDFINRLIENFNSLLDIKPSESEVVSWKNSLKVLSTVLEKTGLNNPYIFIEYKLPTTSRRADVILFGLNKNNKPLALVIELKQWSEIKESAISDTVSVAGIPLLHPSIQVKGYCEYLKYYHKAFTESNFEIRGCVYLHNLDLKYKGILEKIITKDILDEYPLFFNFEEDKLVNFLKNIFSDEYVSIELLEKLTKPEYSPSTKLLDFLVQTIDSNFEWKLLDEQKIVFNAVIDSIKDAIAKNNKSVIIVSGGPGTGKSVLSIQLLAFAARKGYKVAYATGSKAFITVLQAITQNLSDELFKKIYNVKTKKQIPVKDIFVLSKDIAKIGTNMSNYFDLVVYDEGHRLWDYRRNIFNNINKQLSNTPMIEEIINATKVLCIFLDENQTVRANEIGSMEYIEKECERLNITPQKFNLDIQFRCSGSSAYIDFVDSLLGLSSNEINLSWKKYDAYEFLIYEDISKMYNDLKIKKENGYKCRIVAGFCWPWNEPDKFRKLPHDIKIGKWSAPWIEKTDLHLPHSHHRYYKWAREDDYFDQVGSIYSVQGFEFDYVGLIFGNDLVIQKGKWLDLLENNKDNQFKRDLKQIGQNPLERLKNIYRVLLTRGMKGTFVYFVDEETKNYVKNLLDNC